MNVSMKRDRNSSTAFVTFYNRGDSEYAVYYLYDSTFQGLKIRSYFAPMTDKDKEDNEKEKQEKKNKSLDKDKKGKSKLPRRSLRYLAPQNVPTPTNTNQGIKSNPKSNYQNQTRTKEGGQRPKSQNNVPRQGYKKRYKPVQKEDDPNHNEVPETKTDTNQNTNTQNERRLEKKYEVTIRNTETNEVSNYMMNQIELDNYFPRSMTKNQ